MSNRSSLRSAAVDRARTWSPGAKLAARGVLYLPREILDRARGGDPLIPPRWLCTRYIRPPGAWSGFDIVPRAISWCQKHVTSRHPNFSFQHADVFNAKYNPRGSLAAHEFEFPYPDGSFDLVYLTSVFTHMLPQDVQHYTREIARVLRPGGKAFLTYFILGAETQARLARGEATMSFDVWLDGARAMHAGSPEAAVAFEEHDVRTMLASVDLVDTTEDGRRIACGSSSIASMSA